MVLKSINNYPSLLYIILAAFVLLIGFAITISSWWSGSADGRLLYVDDDGVDCPVEKCYSSIDEAHHAARPGDIVLVFPGYYNFSISSLKPGVTTILSSADQLSSGLTMPKDCYDFPIITKREEGLVAVACSSLSPSQYHMLHGVLGNAEEKLKEAGLMHPEGPVIGAWYENGSLTITLNRPLTDIETQKLINSGIGPYRIYREYGPPEHQCEDGAISLIWRREWKTENGPPDLLHYNSYEEARTALEKRFGDAFMVLGHPFETRDTSIVRVLFRNIDLTDSDLSFIDSLIPATYAVEVWVNVKSLTSTLSIPPFIKMTCGYTT